MPLLSVIIPVFNCAPVITRCLDSIDFKDAEIIVVDDGSADNSAHIVSEYAISHPKVCLVQKENGGVSSARNCGIEVAKGSYLMFVDADDYLAPNGIKRVLKLAQDTNADVLKYRLKWVSNDDAQDKNSVESCDVSTEVIRGKYKALFRNDISDYHVVDALFKSSLIKDNHIRFHTDLHLHEDDVFMGELYCHTETIVVTDLPLYRYVQSSFFSSTHDQSVERQRQLIESGLLAVKYRKSYVSSYCPETLPMERLKYMRWVCLPKTAWKAGYSLKEYKALLLQFEECGCWPLDYRWMHTARLDWSWKVRAKNRVKTFLCNHPGFAFLLLKTMRIR